MYVPTHGCTLHRSMEYMYTKHLGAAHSCLAYYISTIRSSTARTTRRAVCGMLALRRADAAVVQIQIVQTERRTWSRRTNKTTTRNALAIAFKGTVHGSNSLLSIACR